MNIELPNYMRPHIANHARYHMLMGGRGSGKTTSVARLFVLYAFASKKKILCCREIQKSIKDSTYASIEKAVNELNLRSSFKFTLNNIICKRTGSEFIFKGLRSNVTQIASMEGIDLVYGEEAQSFSEESLEILIPTIRQKNSSLWFNWNPRLPTDPIEKLKKLVKDEAIISHVNYTDNPFFPEVLDKDRLLCEKYAPDIYAHIWLGHYRMNVGERVVLPYKNLVKCVGAAEKLNYKAEGWGYVGLDVADGGKDKPAYCLRRGSLIEEVKEISGDNGYKIAKHIYPIIISNRIARCHYDAVGVGASIKSEFFRLKKTGRLTFFPEPFLGGAKVKGPDTVYISGITNKNFFARLNAQAYWNLRLRMENTLRALNGEKVNLDYCLFFKQDISDKALQELCQVVYDLDVTDKVIVDKQPDNADSPNMADAISMAFVRDCNNGLRAY